MSDRRHTPRGTDRRKRTTYPPLLKPLVQSVYAMPGVTAETIERGFGVPRPTTYWWAFQAGWSHIRPQTARRRAKDLEEDQAWAQRSADPVPQVVPCPIRRCYRCQRVTMTDPCDCGEAWQRRK